MARRGYRFVATVEPADARPSHPPHGLHPSPLPHPSRRSVRLPVVTAVGVLALFGAIAALFLWREASPFSPPSPPVFTRFTTRAGYSGMAALSPDGKSLAYVSDRSGALEIYVTSFAFGSQDLAVTKDGGNNIDPAWSPDGQWIAFHSRARRGIWIVPATGGTPQQVVDFGSQPFWSPDGSQIVFTSDAGGGNSQSVIWLVSRDGVTRRQLTKVGGPPSGQGMPSWSRDGRYVVFSVSMARRQPALAFVSIADGKVTQFRTPSTAPIRSFHGMAARSSGSDRGKPKAGSCGWPSEATACRPAPRNSCARSTRVSWMGYRLPTMERRPSALRATNGTSGRLTFPATARPGQLPGPSV